METDIKNIHACKGHGQDQWNGECHHQSSTETQREKADQQDNNHRFSQNLHELVDTTLHRHRLV